MRLARDTLPTESTAAPSELAELLLLEADRELRLEALLLRMIRAFGPEDRRRLRRMARDVRDHARGLRRHAGLHEPMPRGATPLGVLGPRRAYGEARQLAGALVEELDRLAERLHRAEALEGALYTQICARSVGEVLSALEHRLRD